MRSNNTVSTATGSGVKLQGQISYLVPQPNNIQQVPPRNPQKNIPLFNDDHAIQVVTKNNYDLKNNIKVEVKCMFPIVQLKENLPQKLQGMVTLSAIEHKEQAKQIRAGVDLICLVDVSSSMQGEKIEQTKATLQTLSNYLSNQDRLCIILFNEEAQRLCPLVVMNAQNKIVLQQQITQIQASGCTSIAAGTELAFKTIKDRRTVNNVTSILILSDGQDDQALSNVSHQLKQFQDHVFTIHSFGFGEDHDEELMSDLAQLKGGSFYYIQNPKIMDECFIEVLGGLISVVADDIIINLVCQAQLKDLKIYNTYGDMWEECIKGYNYKIKVPQFAAGWNRSYVFSLLLPAVNKLVDFQRVQKVLKVITTMKNSQDKQEIKLEADCSLQFFTEKEKIPVSNIDEQVQIEYLRVKGAQCISEARKQCQSSKYQDAQKLLDNIISTIKSQPPRVLMASEQLCRDLYLCKSACNKASFEEYGQKQLQSYAISNQRQAGLTSVVDARGVQTYMTSQTSNDVQKRLVLSLQNSKRQR